MTLEEYITLVKENKENMLEVPYDVDYVKDIIYMCAYTIRKQEQKM